MNPIFLQNIIEHKFGCFLMIKIKLNIIIQEYYIDDVYFPLLSMKKHLTSTYSVNHKISLLQIYTFHSFLLLRLNQNWRMKTLLSQVQCSFETYLLELQHFLAFFLNNYFVLFLPGTWNQPFFQGALVFLTEKRYQKLRSGLYYIN